ncbi:MAG: Uma2 family endonuclease [Pseudanabaena sp. ELA645]
MIALTTDYLSLEDYLQWEEQQEEKHEYVNGMIYAMAGASESHVGITANLTSIILAHLKGSKCKVLSSDMRVNIAAKNIYYYPDILVTCDDRDRLTKNSKSYPCLIIEVLSNSTEAKDRGVKFANYQTIESLQEYVLINQQEQRIEVFRRSDRKFWILQTYTAGEDVELKTINLTIPISSIYEDIEFDIKSEDEV